MVIRQVQCTRPVPKCPLFHLTRGFPHSSYLLLSPSSFCPSLLLSHTHTNTNTYTDSYTHTHTNLFIHPYALVSSGCNESPQPRRLWLRSSNAAIRTVPRTGKSHSSMLTLWNRREWKKLEFDYAEAPDDWLCLGLVPCLQHLLKKKKIRLHLRQKNKRKSNNYCTVVLNSLRTAKFFFFFSDSTMSSRLWQ